MAEKLPALMLYVRDYLADTRVLSNEAKGFYMDLLCYMHISARRGFLQQSNGKPFTSEALARMTSCASADEASRLLQDLITADVLSVTAEGLPFSRRMVRDEHKRRGCSDAGKRGGGNPALRPLKVTYKGEVKGTPKGGVKGALEDEYEDPPSDRDGGVGEEKGPRRRTTPQKPGVEDVAAYCQEQGYGIDPSAFVDHYTANGWMVGKNKMKDWRAAVRTWEQRRRIGPHNQAGPGQRRETRNEIMERQAREFIADYGPQARGAAPDKADLPLRPDAYARGNGLGIADRGRPPTVGGDPRSGFAGCG